jgi:hypothetical protein
LINVLHLSPGQEAPEERHVVVIIHREGTGSEKGYFFDSAERDHGGSGPFDWPMDEAIERAKRFTRESNLQLVVVKAKLPR